MPVSRRQRSTVAGAVGVRGVAERDAKVDRAADRGGRLTVVDRTPPVRLAVHRQWATNGPAAETDRADLDAAAAENPHAHLCPSVVWFGTRLTAGARSRSSGRRSARGAGTPSVLACLHSRVAWTSRQR